MRDDADPDSPAPRSPYDEALAPATERSLRRLLFLLRSAMALVWTAARREVLVSAALTLLSVAAVTVQLLLVRSILAVALDPGAARSVADLLPQLAGLSVATAAGSFAGSANAERRRLLAELTGRHVQSQLLDVAAGVDLEQFETPSFHDHLLRATVNAQIRPPQLAAGLVDMASGVAGSVGIAVVLASLQPLMVPLVLLSFVPLWLAATSNSRALYRMSFALTPADRERNYLTQLLVGKDEAREIRAYELGGFFRRRFERLYDERVGIVRGVVRARQRRSLVASAGAAAVVLAAVAALMQLALSGRMTMAAAGTAVVAVQQLAGRLRTLATGTLHLHECSLFVEDVTSFLARRAGPAPPPSPLAAAEPFRAVHVEGVTFHYPGSLRAALTDVSLEINRGEVVALVGENGSGKTTLVKLLCALYRPSDGRILWNGVDTGTLDPATIRAELAVTFQDSLRYQLSAATNIGVGRPERLDDREALRAAAVDADVDTVLQGLPHGYETLLSRAFLGGTELSSGQWQRVALARAFFRDAGLVILDEPTASLDPRAERDLFEHVRTLGRDRAVLLISHRMSSVQSADRIYVLHGGRMIESGDHQSLMAAAGHYAELYDLQAAGYGGASRR